MTSIPIDRLNDALSGRYRIGREIGEGGMATVYLADDQKHERKVALDIYALAAVLYEMLFNVPTATCTPVHARG